MVNRYAHLAPEHLKGYAETVTLAATSQPRHTGAEPEESKVA
jgi:hypothetical protein